MGLFTDNPNARETARLPRLTRAQTEWVKFPGGYAFSADQAVTPAAYPLDVEQIIASLLQPTHGTELCFSAEDMMTPDMSTAFEHAVLDYVNDPTRLSGTSGLLNGLEQTQQSERCLPPQLANHACEKP